MITSTLAVPFRTMGHDGLINVDMASNDDPSRSGHDLVAVDYDEDRFKGFPVVTATLDYSGTGYRAYFGWLQVVTHHYADPQKPPTSGLDVWPSLAAALPVVSFGYLPTFFDAPANPDHPDMQWIAGTFLVQIAMREPRTLTALAGFIWGYRLHNPTVGVIEPVSATAADWTTMTTAVGSELAGWNLQNTH